MSSFLDFIKNRHSQQQGGEHQSQQQQPETAKQMYAREAGKEKAAAKSVSQISDEQKARVDKVGADLQKSIQTPGTENAPSSPTDSTDSAQPMRQPMMNQDKTAPTLSPTSAQAGAPTTEQESASPSHDSQAATQNRPQTIARTTPSWER
jgi:hypothetical protein